MPSSSGCAYCLFHDGFLLGLFLTLKMKVMVSYKKHSLEQELLFSLSELQYRLFFVICGLSKSQRQAASSG